MECQNCANNIDEGEEHHCTNCARSVCDDCWFGYDEKTGEELCYYCKNEFINSSDGEE